jgi:hypothetical protein
MTSPVARTVAVLGLLALVAAAGCSPTNPSAAPSTEPSAQTPARILGCLSIGAAECQFVAEQVVVRLPEERGAPFAIVVQLYGCPNVNPCPPTLGVWEGKVTVEYADRAEPIEVTVAGPPQAPRFGDAAMTWSGLIDASSPRVASQGPFLFELGHCGLTWQVDFDGSFWLPVGQVDGDASAAVNAERGQMVLLGPNLAQYRGETGFTARLARFPGPKHLWLCA